MTKQFCTENVSNWNGWGFHQCSNPTKYLVTTDRLASMRVCGVHVRRFREDFFTKLGYKIEAILKGNQ